MLFFFGKIDVNNISIENHIIIVNDIHLRVNVFNKKKNCCPDVDLKWTLPSIPGQLIRVK